MAGGKVTTSRQTISFQFVYVNGFDIPFSGFPD